jgi:hypothetical protein
MNHFASFIKRQALPLFCALTIALSFAATQLPPFRLRLKLHLDNLVSH